jgi:ferric-dicitrate binding protein FerR (iron transport regulator)
VNPSRAVDLEGPALWQALADLEGRRVERATAHERWAEARRSKRRDRWIAVAFTTAAGAFAGDAILGQALAGSLVAECACLVVVGSACIYEALRR